MNSVQNLRVASEIGAVVNSVSKAIMILSLLGSRPGLTLQRICDLLSLPKSSAYSILATLEKEGLVERESGVKTYHLGIRLFEIGNLALGDYEIRRTAEPYIRRLNEELDETVHLTIPIGGEVLYIDCYESTKRLRTYPVIGVRAPMHSTAVGKDVLAYLPEREVERIILEKGLERSTVNTITDPSALRVELAETIARGYSIDDEEHEEGVRCVGAPILDYTGSVVASISVSGPVQRMPDAEIPKTGTLVARTALEISRKLGYPRHILTRETGPTSRGSIEE